MGSRGHNRFVSKALVDVSVTNSNPGTPPIKVDASGNYWGGGAPVVAPATPTDVLVNGNVTFDAPTHLTADPVH